MLQIFQVHGYVYVDRIPEISPITESKGEFPLKMRRGKKMESEGERKKEDKEEQTEGENKKRDKFKSDFID